LLKIGRVEQNVELMLGPQVAANEARIANQTGRKFFFSQNQILCHQRGCAVPQEQI
jgi:hypothetical protein